MKITVLFLTVVLTAVSVHGSCCCCEPGWTGYGGSCYRFFGNPRTHSDAQNVCGEYEARLVKITTVDENAFLYFWWTSTTTASTVWIGLSDAQSEGTWEWTDGTTGSFRNWDTSPRQPDNRGNQDCATMWKRDGSDATWDDDHCYDEWPFICEKTA